MADFDEYAYLEEQMQPQKRPRDDKRGAPNDLREDDRRGRRDYGDQRQFYDGGRGRSGRHGGRPYEERDYYGRDYQGYQGRGYRGRGYDRGYDRNNRDGGRPHRQRSRSPKRRGDTPPEVRLLKAKEKELKDLDRDIRTVFAYNLNLKANERDIFEFFSKAGRVSDVKLIMDRSTKRSKGFAYIEFAKQDSVLGALGLSGQMLLGQTVMVKSSEAEKNMAWEAQQAASASNLNAALLSGAPCRLLISNLHVVISEPNLRPLFEPFGALDSVEIHRDLSGASKGQASVQYKSFDDATRAMQHLNGMDVAGLTMKISIVPPTGAAAGAIPGLGELDEDEERGGGLKLTSQARAALMNRLASSAGLQVPGGAGQGAQGKAAGGAASQMEMSVLDQGVLGPASPIPTVCLLLKNMFDPDQETEAGWEEEIASDVRDECSKFSEILHVFVDKSSKGHVYLKFASLEGSKQAQRTLHGRFFAGKQIVAEYQFLQPYNNFFKC